MLNALENVHENSLHQCPLDCGTPFVCRLPLFHPRSPLSSPILTPPYCGSAHTWPSQIRAREKTSERREKRDAWWSEGKGGEGKGAFGRRGLSAFRWSKKLMTALLCCEKAGRRRSVTGNHGLCQWAVTKGGRPYAALSFYHIYIAYMVALCRAEKMHSLVLASANNVNIFGAAKRQIMGRLCFPWD